jgi:hypothetical protein
VWIVGENEAIVAVLSLAILSSTMAGREPERAGLSPASKVEHSA